MTATIGRQRRSRLATVLKLTLAAGALVGMGAAATSAAWTDNAYFTGKAKSASVDLRGRLSGSSTYLAADSAATGVAVDLGTVADMVPGVSVVKTIELWNAGSAPLKLAWDSNNPATLIAASCVTVAYSTLPTGTLAGDPTGVDAASKATATVTLTMQPNAAQATCANKEAPLQVIVQGTTVSPAP